jgi:hypothetical protein
MAKMPSNRAGPKTAPDRTRVSEAIKEFVAMEGDVVDLLLECFNGRKDILKNATSILTKIARSEYYPAIRKVFPDIIKSYLIGITTALIYDANPGIQLEMGEEAVGENLARVFESVDFEACFEK